MQFKDYYEVLGVKPDATDAAIKAAYRRLARKFHPDVSKVEGAEEKFKGANEAYEALKDPAKRKAYDQLRARGYRPGEEFNPPPDFSDGQGFSGHGGDWVAAAVTIRYEAASMRVTVRSASIPPRSLSHCV